MIGAPPQDRQPTRFASRPTLGLPLLLVGLLLLGACGSANADLVAGQAAYDQAAYLEARSFLRRWLAEQAADAPSTDLSRASALLGQTYLKLNRLSLALQQFERATAPERPEPEQTVLLSRVAASLFAADQYAHAADWYDRLATHLGEAKSAATAYARSGEAYRRAGLWPESVDQFRILRDRFPESAHRRTALRAIHWRRRGYRITLRTYRVIENALAYHESLQASEGLFITVESEQRADHPLYRVCLRELFRTWSAAQVERDRLRRLGYPTTIDPQ